MMMMMTMASQQIATSHIPKYVMRMRIIFVFFVGYFAIVF